MQSLSEKSFQQISFDFIHLPINYREQYTYQQIEKYGKI